MLRISLRKHAIPALVGIASIAMMGAKPVDDAPIPLTVPKATCGPNDHPETGLQGQVPAALRATGFKGFNCNLQLIGQSKGEGANWQTTQFIDAAGRRCAYHGTASPARSLPNRQHFGVPVVDITAVSLLRRRSVRLRMFACKNDIVLSEYARITTV